MIIARVMDLNADFAEGKNVFVIENAQLPETHWLTSGTALNANKMHTKLKYCDFYRFSFQFPSAILFLQETFLEDYILLVFWENFEFQHFFVIAEKSPPNWWYVRYSQTRYAW